MLISMNMGSKWGKKSLSKRKQNKTKKQNPGDTSVMLGQFPCHLRAGQACVSKSFQTGCLGRSPESLFQPRESCEVYAEGRKANRHTKANPLLQGELKILLGTGAGPGAGSSCGDPEVAQHSVFRVERPRHVSVAREEQVAWPRVLTSGS